MNSIALWWDTQEKVNKDDSPKIHLDINIWLSKDEKHNSIEFGLKISNFPAIKSIYLFLPFICNHSDFSDQIIKLSVNAN